MNLVLFLKSYLDWLVLGVLGTMSLTMTTFVIERYIYYSRVDLQKFRNLEELDLALTNGLTIVATIGTNAPYIGLLGTVLAILVAFYDIGQSGNIEAATMMTGLALALKSTALGLLVAIPSLAFYNALLRRTEVLKVRWRAMDTSAVTHERSQREA